MKKIAYIRVSTNEQRPDRQIDGLKAISDELYIESLSAVSRARPIYDDIMRRLCPGDVFLIWDLDRAYRSAKDALNELDRLRARSVEIEIANMAIDTSTPIGRFLYTLVSGFAELERGMLSQRTREGIEAARKRGKRIGRPPKLSEVQLQEAARRVAEAGESFESVGRLYGVSGWTVSRSLQRAGLLEEFAQSKAF